MAVDRFGRTSEQVKSDQRKILEQAYSQYPGYADGRSIPKNSASRFDIHDLLDHGLLETPSHFDRRGVVGDSTFIPMYRLSVGGLDKIRQPEWLDSHFPKIMHITAVGSSVNIGSPGASASTQTNINILIRLKEEIESSNLPPQERAKLLKAIGDLASHPLVIALLSKWFGG